MSNHIDFIDFKKLLNNKNILLFDGQYRIAHFRFNNLLKQLEQNGGNDGNNSQSILIDNTDKLKDKLINNNLLERLINSLLENNTITTNYIVDLIHKQI